MPIPTEPVVSLPRPQYLQDAFAAYDAGAITLETLKQAQDKAACESVHRMEETGADVITDGEQRVCTVRPCNQKRLIPVHDRKCLTFQHNPGIIFRNLPSH